MPIVKVDLWAGQPKEKKAEAADVIATGLGRVLGCNKEAVIVLFNDVELDNWSVGGKLVSDTV
ncbi:MAG: tautomerase family protein [Sphingobium sp.]|mgnify:CR=1 FL=1|jgi:4-oxalocrotonate tautomerase family enzyme|nr:tautomerase family protein [Sphingobium sp.]MCI1271409.1 tautomerase family protein [Sphingobium sp.]MCI2053240.1 tautomerase family protein [Sphingobium sp.]